MYYVIPDLELSQLDAYENRETAERVARATKGIFHVLMHRLSTVTKPIQTKAMTRGDKNMMEYLHVGMPEVLTFMHDRLAQLRDQLNGQGPVLRPEPTRDERRSIEGRIQELIHLRHTIQVNEQARRNKAGIMEAVRNMPPLEARLDLAETIEQTMEREESERQLNAELDETIPEDTCTKCKADLKSNQAVRVWGKKAGRYHVQCAPSLEERGTPSACLPLD